MSCAAARRAMFDALDGAPPPADHVGRCEPCRALFDSLKRVDDLMRAEPLVEPPPGLAERIRRSVVRPAPSLRREFLRIVAAVAVVLGLSAYAASALPTRLPEQTRLAGAVESGVGSARNLIQGAFRP